SSSTPTATDSAARLRTSMRCQRRMGATSEAAARLHVHKNTVLYRVRKAEELPGRPVTDGRLAIEVAGAVARTVFRRVRSVGFSARPAVTERDSEGVDHWFPAHRPSDAAGPGRVQAAGDKVQTVQR